MDSNNLAKHLRVVALCSGIERTTSDYLDKVFSEAAELEKHGYSAITDEIDRVIDALLTSLESIKMQSRIMASGERAASHTEAIQ